MRAFGARVIEHGDDFEMAREEAARLAASEELEFAPSYAPDLVKGVATYSLELFRAVPLLDALYVPIGLGSGICGAIRVRDLLGLRTEIIGVQAAGAAAYARSFEEGHVVALNRAETHADGVAVRQPDAGAFAIIRAGASRIVTVSDDAIAAAIRAYWTDTHNLVEGAGAAPLAALLAERERMAGKRIGVVISGGNIDLALFRSGSATGSGRGELTDRIGRRACVAGRRLTDHVATTPHRTDQIVGAAMASFLRSLQMKTSMIFISGSSMPP